MGPASRLPLGKNYVPRVAPQVDPDPFRLSAAIAGRGALLGIVLYLIGLLCALATSGLEAPEEAAPGTSRTVVNVEWRRRLTGELLHIAALGFTRSPTAESHWGARVGPSTEGWRGDVGAGVLVELTRASLVRILRFELAFPDRGGGPVYLITTDSLF